MSRCHRFLLAFTALLAPSIAFAASSNVNSLTASGSIVGTQLFYCPIGAATDLKCTAAQVAAYNYSLMNGDCTATGTGGITCTKTNGTAFTALATTAPGTGVATALTHNLNATGGIVSPTPSAAGDIIYWNGTTWVILSGNTGSTNILQETSSGVPSWVAPASAGVSSISTTCPTSGPSTGAVTLTNTLQILNKTANYTSLASDCGATITFTLSGNATFTLLAPATAGTGFGYASVNNIATSTANLTITPPSGTINGAASLVLWPNSSVGLWTDGSNYFTTGGAGQSTTVFTASGTWTPNPSMVRSRIGCLGGGGGGGAGGATVSGSNALVYGGGGGGGGSSKVSEYSVAEIRALFATTVTVSIVAGGTGGAGASNTSGGNGSVGGTSTVGSGGNILCQGFGGGGGGGGGTAGSAGGGGAGTSANGGTATQNSTSGGTAGPGGGTAGVANAVAGYPYACAGMGGVGGTTTTATAHASQTALCTTAGPSAGGVSVAGGAQAGNGGVGTTGVSSSNSLYGGGSAGAAGGSGQWADGTFVMNGLGIIGGGSGGSGAACLGTGAGCTPGNGGAGGFGSGGAGGGAAEDTTTAVVGGTGGAGGPPVIEIIEFNAP